MRIILNTTINWLISNVISVVAIAISVFALIQSHRASKRSNQIAIQQLRIEEAREQDRMKEQSKAIISAEVAEEIVSLGSSTMRKSKLIIANRGAAAARDVVIHIDGVNINEHKSVIQRTDTQSICIGPHSNISYPLVTTRGMPLPSQIVVKWVDNSGESGDYHHTLIS